MAKAIEIEVWSATWYPGHSLLTRLAERLNEEAPTRKCDARIAIKCVDDHPTDAEGLRITTVPMARVIESGKETRRELGALGEEVFRDMMRMPAVKEKNGRRRKGGA